MCKVWAIEKEKVDAKEMQSGAVKGGLLKRSQEQFIFMTGFKRGDERKRYSGRLWIEWKVTQPFWTTIWQYL